MPRLMFLFTIWMHRTSRDFVVMRTRHYDVKTLYFKMADDAIVAFSYVMVMKIKPRRLEACKKKNLRDAKLSIKTDLFIHIRHSCKIPILWEYLACLIQLGGSRFPTLELLLRSPVLWHLIAKPHFTTISQDGSIWS